MLRYFRAFDFDGLEKIDNRSYQSGTSEVKLYVPVMVAASELKFDMNLVDYVPVYRTEAGTGEGFGQARPGQDHHAQGSGQEDHDGAQVHGQEDDNASLSERRPGSSDRPAPRLRGSGRFAFHRC